MSSSVHERYTIALVLYIYPFQLKLHLSKRHSETRDFPLPTFILHLDFVFATQNLFLLFGQQSKPSSGGSREILNGV